MLLALGLARRIATWAFLPAGPSATLARQAVLLSCCFSSFNLYLPGRLCAFWITRGGLSNIRR